MVGKQTECAKRPIALAVDKRLSTAPRALSFDANKSWGSAPLHPRLYAIAALRGLNPKRFTDLTRVSFCLSYRRDKLKVYRTLAAKLTHYPKFEQVVGHTPSPPWCFRCLN